MIKMVEFDMAGTMINEDNVVYKSRLKTRPDPSNSNLAKWQDHSNTLSWYMQKGLI